MSVEEKLRMALESMVWQFAYHGNNGKKPNLHAGGLSALEEAFDALGWADPHIIEDMDLVICDVKDCLEPVSGQGISWRESGYWCCCLRHNAEARKDKPQPKMKTRAIEREQRRDRKTGILASKGTNA